VSEQYIPDGEDQEGYVEWLEQKDEIALLRGSLAIFIHAHATGNSVPPHIEAAARALLKEVPRE
jgi:hypothetical protein